MKKKRYGGEIKKVPGFEIFLNINHLEKGKYELKIINKNKIIRRTHFTKD